MSEPGLSWKPAWGWRLDAALAAALAIGAFAYIAAAGQMHPAVWPLLVCNSVACAVLPARTVRPVIVALVTAAAAALPGLIGPAGIQSLPDVVIGLAFFVAYSLGTSTTVPVGLVCVAALIVGMQVGTVFNPFIEMIAVGPWLAGRVMASRRELTRRIEIRNSELADERERFASEAVRYERARIARELHDIVAHNVSAIVVQAGAGQRLADRDPDSAAEVFTAIAESAESARTEIDRLVELLSDPVPSSGEPDLTIVEELVQRAAATGLSVECRLAAEYRDLPGPARDVAYRVVQESLTNALKHAPGSAVQIDLSPVPVGLALRVVNTVSLAAGSGLESSGGGHGLLGMKERVIAWGGKFSAGPTPSGGWAVEAILPFRPEH